MSRPEERTGPLHPAPDARDELKGLTPADAAGFLYLAHFFQVDPEVLLSPWEESDRFEVLRGGVQYALQQAQNVAQLQFHMGWLEKTLPDSYDHIITSEAKQVWLRRFLPVLAQHMAPFVPRQYWIVDPIERDRPRDFGYTTWRQYFDPKETASADPESFRCDPEIKSGSSMFRRERKYSFPQSIAEEESLEKLLAELAPETKPSEWDRLGDLYARKFLASLEESSRRRDYAVTPGETTITPALQPYDPHKCRGWNRRTNAYE